MPRRGAECEGDATTPRGPAEQRMTRRFSSAARLRRDFGARGGLQSFLLCCDVSSAARRASVAGRAFLAARARARERLLAPSRWGRKPRENTASVRSPRLRLPEPHRRQRATHPLAAFSHRLIRQTNHIKNHFTWREMNLNIHLDRINALKGRRRYSCYHFSSFSFYVAYLSNTKSGQKKTPIYKLITKLKALKLSNAVQSRPKPAPQYLAHQSF